MSPTTAIRTQISPSCARSKGRNSKLNRRCAPLRGPLPGIVGTIPSLSECRRTSHGRAKTAVPQARDAHARLSPTAARRIPNRSLQSGISFLLIDMKSPGVTVRPMAGVDIVHIPYKGAAPAMNDLIGGHVTVTSKERAPSLPDAPTMDEAGVKGFESTGRCAGQAVRPRFRALCGFGDLQMGRRCEGSSCTAAGLAVLTGSLSCASKKLGRLSSDRKLEVPELVAQRRFS